MSEVGRLAIASSRAEGPHLERNRFQQFLNAFPPTEQRPVDAEALAADIRGAFGVAVPPDLVSFWRTVGCGSFADGELYFFGPLGLDTRESLLDWNRRPFWRDVLISPSEGGPVFFAETCFGDQIGFRYKSETICIPVLYSIATIELWVMAPEFERLFPEVLTERAAVADLELLAAVKQHVGKAPPGHWFCPIISPRLGGTDNPRNFMAMTPAAFAQCTIAEWKALEKL